MPEPCGETPAIQAGFIGYRRLMEENSEVVRIYLNCKSESDYEGPVDVAFQNGKARFAGLEELPVIKKFNRFVGALEERAREESVPRERVFKSAQDLLYFLSKIKNSRNFDAIKKG